MNNRLTFLSLFFLLIGSYTSSLFAEIPLTIKEKLEVKGPYAVLPSPKTGSETYTDADLRRRLAETKSDVIRPRLTPGVKSYVRTYTVRRRESTEIMIGKTAIYFPIFEKHLREAGLPTDLKYLPIIESALKPEARSPVGAGGLWQFMPSTGKMYGLKINSYVDERSDPNKASKAAAKFLGDLYRQYGDWALCLAAYNAGPGRVNKAIKKGRSRNFWKIQKYLPKETRSYVPGFIAATYLMQHYEAHGLTAVMPEYDLQVTETTKIYNDMTFQQIAEVSGTSYHIVQTLNPSYKKGMIKADVQEGSYLILPYTSIGAFMRFQHGDAFFANSSPKEKVEANKETIRTEYMVRAGDDLKSIAAIFNCKPENIKSWNRLSSSLVSPGQRLVIFEQIRVSKRQKKTYPKIDLLSSTRIKNVSSSLSGENKNDVPFETPKESNNRDKDGEYLYYSVRRGESIKDIADKFEGVNIEDILEDNDVRSSNQVKTGMVLMIRKI